MILRALLLSLMLFWTTLPAAAVAGLPGAGADAAGETALLSLAPAPLRGVLQGINRVQADAGRMINGQLRRFRAEGTVAAGLWLCLVGFAYGVLHAAGPGHSKLLVSSYVLASRSRVRTGVMLSAGAAMAQAASAILLVGIPVGLLHWRRAETLNDTRYLELASYALMMAVGVLMIHRAWRGTGCCAHPHHPHGHHHHDGHEDQHGHGEPIHGTGPRKTLNALLALVMVARPCSGSIIILLFALANGMTRVGVLAVLCVAAGVACTTTAVGLVSLSAGRLLTRALSGGSYLVIAERGLAWTGALAITSAGALLLIATLAAP